MGSCLKYVVEIIVVILLYYYKIIFFISEYVNLSEVVVFF